MTQYIDKSALVAEIKERIDRNDEKAASFSSNSENDYLYRIKEEAYKDLLSFINTLEVQEVDLKKAEQFIQDCTKKCSNELCSVEDRYGKTVISYHEWVTPDQARRASEITKEETIEKACKWLATEFDEITRLHLDDKLIDMFRKAMEE